MAIEMLGLSSYAEDKFCSEIDPSARAVLEHNFTSKMFYDDMTTRDHKKLPKVTLYGAGFPCTSYSAEGAGAGLGCDSGAVGLHCVMTVAESRPKSFIFENTKHLASSNHKADFIFIMDALASIVDKTTSTPEYFLTYQVLNTKDVGGLPQNRERIYIVGIKKSAMRRKLKWPSGCPAMPLSGILEGKVVDPPQLPTTTTEQRNYLSCVEEMLKKKMNLTDNVVCDIGGGFFNRRGVSHHMTIGHSPCLTRARCSTGGYYVFAKQRKMLTVEMTRLQGIPDGRLRIPSGVTETKFRGMVGNSFTVTVVARIVDRILRTMNITHRLIGDDDGVEATPWQDLKLEMQGEMPTSCASSVKRKRVALCK